MRLDPEWKKILRRAWSVKFMVLAGILSAGEVFMQTIDPGATSGVPRGLFAALSGMLSAFALVSRVMAQHEAEKNAE